jgi:single-strand DNA-binding protein
MTSVKGTIKKITEVQTKNDFRFRKLILDTGGEYPQVLSIDFTQNNCGLLDAWAEGNEVEVLYNLRGREWENPEGVIKYFTSLQGWRIKEDKGEVSTNDQSPDRDEMPF